MEPTPTPGEAAIDRLLKAVIDEGRKLKEQGAVIKALAAEVAELREVVNSHTRIFKELARANGVDPDATLN